MDYTNNVPTVFQLPIRMLTQILVFTKVQIKFFLPYNALLF